VGPTFNSPADGRQIVANRPLGTASGQTISKFAGSTWVILSAMRRTYTKPEMKKIDRQGAEGKRLLTELEACEKAGSEPVPLQMSVLIRAHMPDGERISENGLTSMVSPRGCLLTMETKPGLGQRVMLVNPRSGVEQVGTVVRVEESSNGHFEVAFEFDSLGSRLWSD
jgi:hypothetical protein